jgi:hypothetical protein
MTRTPILYCDDTDSEIELPFKWIICGACDGHGKSSAYLGAFTGEQMREDPDFADDYRRGFYDRACDDCGGTGKVKVADFSRMTKQQRRDYRKQQRDSAEIDRIQQQERLFEGGWRELGWFGEH